MRSEEHAELHVKVDAGLDVLRLTEWKWNASVQPQPAVHEKQCAKCSSGQISRSPTEFVCLKSLGMRQNVPVSQPAELVQQFGWEPFTRGFPLSISPADTETARQKQRTTWCIGLLVSVGPLVGLGLGSGLG